MKIISGLNPYDICTGALTWRKFGCHRNVHQMFDVCNQKCLLWIGQPQKPSVIGNKVLNISRRNAFIAISVPKLVDVVTPLCRLYTGVPKMNLLIAETM